MRRSAPMTWAISRATLGFSARQTFIADLTDLTDFADTPAKAGWL
jgi:hypothetical protein